MELINWVIPKEFWGLHDPAMIQKFRDMLDDILETTYSQYAGHKESLEIELSRVIDKQNVDSNDIVTYWYHPRTRITPDIDDCDGIIKNLNIDKNELFDKIVPSSYEKLFEETYVGSKTSTIPVLCIDKKIKDLLGPAATFKVKVRGAYRYHEKGGKIYHDWAVSVTTQIYSDDLILLKLSMD